MSARFAVAAMTAYTLELREAGVKLNQNESPFDVPPELKRDVLARLAERPWNLYPDFESSELRGALASAYGFEAEEILVGNGSNELLAAAIAAFVGPGTPVVFPRPTFTLYEKLITVAGGLPVPIEFEPDSGLLPLDAMLRALRGLRDPVAIVCSPNNPTGGVLPVGGLARLLESGATVLFDRAYGDFANPVILSREGEGSLFTPTAATRESLRCAQGDDIPLHDRLVTFSTFSKAWGLAALRVGWLASTARTCREIRKVKLPYSLNTLSETIAVVALEHRALRDANVARVIAERERVVRFMREIPSIETFPTSANFVAFRSRLKLDDFLRRDILIRDISSYPRLANCLRVSIGSRPQNDAFLGALKELA
jgi:histidinol-phosphate aminotransferase